MPSLQTTIKILANVWIWEKWTVSCLQRGGAQVEVAGGSIVMWVAAAVAKWTWQGNATDLGIWIFWIYIYICIYIFLFMFIYMFIYIHVQYILYRSKRCYLLANVWFWEKCTVSCLQRGGAQVEVAGGSVVMWVAAAVAKWMNMTGKFNRSG
jgi:hypothetical protein